MQQNNGSDRRAARDLLRAGRNDRPIEARVETLEKLMEIVMADLDTLNGLLSDIATDASTVASQHTDLVNELQALQQQAAANQPVDLTGAIATAQTIKTTLDGIAQAASSAAPSGTTAAPAAATPAAPADATATTETLATPADTTQAPAA